MTCMLLQLCRPEDSIVTAVASTSTAAPMATTNATSADSTTAAETVAAQLVLAPAGSVAVEQTEAQDPDQFSVAEFGSSSAEPLVAASAAANANAANAATSAATTAAAALTASCIAGCGKGRQVCGADGRTQSSSCVAACLRVPIRHQGPCRASDGAAAASNASTASSASSYTASSAQEQGGRVGNADWPSVSGSALIRLPLPIKLLVRAKAARNTTAPGLNATSGNATAGNTSASNVISSSSFTAGNTTVSSSSNATASNATVPAAAKLPAVVPVPEQRPQAIMSLGEQLGPGDYVAAGVGVAESGGGAGSAGGGDGEEGDGPPNGMLPVAQLAAQAAQRSRAQRMMWRKPQQGG
jgi:hypothetical protein